MFMEQRNAPEVNMLIQEVNQRVTDSFSHAVTLGENSEIFKFNIVSDSDDKHAVHMTFYEGITVTVLLANV